jgi:hypothetical protein
LALRLPPATVFVVLPGDGCENVEHHPVDRVEHAAREVVDLSRRHNPGGGKVERDDPDLTTGEFSLQSFPVNRSEPGQAIHLFREENVTGTSISQESEQLRAMQLRAGLVLNIERRDAQPMV